MQPYLHESRHLHALNRVRGTGGRFLSNKKLQQRHNMSPSRHPATASATATLKLQNNMSKTDQEGHGGVGFGEYVTVVSTHPYSDITTSSVSDSSSNMFQQSSSDGTGGFLDMSPSRHTGMGGGGGALQCHTGSGGLLRGGGGGKTHHCASVVR